MLCPRCGNQWDGSRNSCSRCGLNSYLLDQPEKVERLAPFSSAIPHRPERPSNEPIVPAHQLSQMVLTQTAQVIPQQRMPNTSPLSLLPGTQLREGRYLVQELVERQNWPSGAFEAVWAAHDLQQEQQVTICEIVVPGSTVAQKYSIMRTAALALVSLRHPQIPPLLAAFSDQGCCCFVFERIAKETLLDRLNYLQHPFPEQEVVEFCLQMTDVLELLAQKTPPLVHGLICPEHVYILSDAMPRYALGNFSVLTAGRAIQNIANAGRSRLSPYTAPEFAQDAFDTRNDLYSVLATAYHLATGRAPAVSGGTVPRAQSVQPILSTAFDAVLARGLHFASQQRYQHPSQLRQDLLAVRAQAANVRPLAPTFVSEPVPMFPAREKRAEFVATPPSVPAPAPPPSPMPFPIMPTSPTPFPIMPTTLEDDEEEAVLLPAPEMLPPMRVGNDRLEAVIGLLILLCILGVITLLSHFHV